MIDYLAVLNRTLAGFPNPQEDLRTKLYERARITIQRQLESREPNINENQINLEMRKLEEAILTIEQGYATGVEDNIEDTSVADSVGDTAQQEEEQETQQTLPEMVSEPPVPETPMPETPVPETPTGVEDSAQHTLNIEDTSAADTSAADTNVGDSVGDTAQQEEEEQKQEIEQQTIAERDPIDDILKKLDEPNLTLQEDNRRTSDTSGNDTQSMAQVPQTQVPQTQTPQTQVPQTPQTQTPQTQRANEIPVEPMIARERKTKRGSKAFLYMILILAIGAGGYVAWMNFKSELLNLIPVNQIADTQTTQQSEPISEPTSQTQEQNTQNENEQELTEPKTVKTVTIKPKVKEEETEGAVEPSPEPTAQIAKTKAVLYETGSDGKVDQALNGEIQWSATPQPLEAGGPSRKKVIHARIEFPDRQMLVFMNITNHDFQQLPASHLIDITFVIPKEVSDSAVENVSQFILKDNEEDIGKILNATATKIDEGIFLLALNNLEQARQDNEKLLLNRKWIDIPIQYRNGTKALISLEKGATGDKVFKEVFNTWGQNQGG